MPVPETTAEHWLVWPVCTLAGVQETLTDVMAGDVGKMKLPPIQPVRHSTPVKKR